MGGAARGAHNVSTADTPAGGGRGRDGAGGGAGHTRALPRPKSRS